MFEKIYESIFKRTFSPPSWFEKQNVQIIMPNMISCKLTWGKCLDRKNGGILECKVHHLEMLFNSGKCTNFSCSVPVTSIVIFHKIDLFAKQEYRVLRFMQLVPGPRNESYNICQGTYITSWFFIVRLPVTKYQINCFPWRRCRILRILILAI